jgi:putative redox protein
MSNTAAPAKGPSRIRATWAGDHRFDTGRRGGPTARIDASGVEGQSPVDALLTALATCTAVDVVDILAKRRTPAERLSVDVAGERAAAIPARIVRLLVAYTIDGPGIDRPSAERAVDLAITKYCSVRASLDPAIPIDYTLRLNGEAGGTIAAVGR